MIVVFDIDGVLADASHREHYVTGKPKDWDSFFAEVGADDVIDHGRDLLLRESVGREVVLLSGRPERTRADTEAWLEAHGISYSRLFLRPDSDRRPAAAFKAGLIRVIGDPSAIALIVDDDDSVLARLAGMGYHTAVFPQPLR